MEVINASHWICCCLQVFHEICGGRLYSRDFEPYECQLLLEFEMKSMMRSANIPAEPLCGIIIQYAFNLSSDPTRDHDMSSFRKLAVADDRALRNHHTGGLLDNCANSLFLFYFASDTFMIVLLL
jgi:hypothetical protein